ncbi:bifunctional phosphoserine phosphatase/homoserine phosphotransferase ThrH [SAR92 clade bacterium H231]|nr:bifunctional phosphoserine phosphatase/homoserine phosphotransferase ThrH [Porticoccaceae bacterium]MCT2532253.1 bifunctional phosphoserine phosphatase/homoserine phosphotransferase ThrH [SAR92 clade bacterium H231]MBT6319301.1 bifunctional phosphoserine phosphatase/homoserine phosphotransferase ThrH [Porticoccaceae bacterium]MDA8735355.1 bifunctional phosphoserine phosphatase/homoserine phosphotransferase ThrH [Porticoccaceae bacterium]MDB2481259.1 bifunctional phosphoserine phosphatase/hom
MEIACLDLEGVLVPEIWIAFAEKTGIQELKKTTRDEPDYDVLMNYRLDLLRQHGLGMNEIQEVIASLKPLDGAVEFIDWLRERFQIVILSDTFYEFASPLMKQLGYPTLLCHRLESDANGAVTNYKLRQANPKRQAIVAFKSLYYRTIAAGDSYNDTTMLGEADAGILFHAPQNVIDEFPQFPAVQTFAALKQEFVRASNRDIEL